MPRSPSGGTPARDSVFVPVVIICRTKATLELAVLIAHLSASFHLTALIYRTFIDRRRIRGFDDQIEQHQNSPTNPRPPDSATRRGFKRYGLQNRRVE